jgi:hypothetical protein
MNATEPITHADARAEGPNFTGDDVPRVMGELARGTYTLFFDREFAVGDKLRSYDQAGIRYHRVDDIEGAYCEVVQVKQNKPGECRASIEGFPFETLLRLIHR